MSNVEFLTDLPLCRQTSPVDVETAIGPADATDRSPNCRLLDASESPNFGSIHDIPRLEFSEFQSRAKHLTDEFFCSMDVPGMVASISALRCLPFHDELVAILLRASLDRKELEQEAAVLLLGTLLRDGFLERSQLVRGYEKLVLSWEDLRLDVPNVHARLVALLSSSVGLLDKSLFARLPQDLLQALQEDLAPGSAKESLLLHLEELTAFKAELAAKLETDLFHNRSIDSLAAFLRSADSERFRHEVVLVACELSLNACPSPSAFWMSCFSPAGLIEEKRNLVLKMLVQLHVLDDDSLLDEVDLQLGFSRLLGITEKLINDRPEVKLSLVALFRGAVEREVLPGEFLKSARRMRFGGRCGVEVAREVQRQTPLHSRRNCGSGDGRQLQMEVQEAISEYFDCRNVEELANIVQELHLSEEEQTKFVRKLFVAGMERNDGDSAVEVVAALLGPCWGLPEVVAAFEQLRDIADDLVLDFPYCREKTNDLVCAAVGCGLLDSSFLVTDVGSAV
jgi:hypothetical protein